MCKGRLAAGYKNGSDVAFIRTLRSRGEPHNTMAKLVNYEDFEDYTPQVGEDFDLVFSEEGKTLKVHPFWDEFSEDVAGYNVYAEDGTYLGNADDKWEIESFL